MPTIPGVTRLVGLIDRLDRAVQWFDFSKVRQMDPREVTGYNKQSAIDALRAAGIKVAEADLPYAGKGLIHLPKVGPGIRLWGAIDYLQKVHGFVPVRKEG